ncbi:hypothetical protein BH11PAT1_BH11PAT1_6930 [soil metagenome]
MSVHSVEQEGREVSPINPLTDFESAKAPKRKNRPRGVLKRCRELLGKEELTLEERIEVVGLMTRPSMEEFPRRFVPFQKLYTEMSVSCRRNGNLVANTYEILQNDGIPYFGEERSYKSKGKIIKKNIGCILSEDKERAIKLLTESKITQDFVRATAEVAYGPSLDSRPLADLIRGDKYVSVGNILAHLILRKSKYSLLLKESPVSIYWHKNRTRGGSYWVAESDAEILSAHVTETLATHLYLNISADWEKSSGRLPVFQKRMVEKITAVKGQLTETVDRKVWIGTGTP